jgi:hypothetical protein
MKDVSKSPRRKRDAFSQAGSDIEGPLATDEAINVIAEILAKEYLRYQRKLREPPAETPPAPAERAPRRRTPAQAKVKRVRLTDPTGHTSEAPIQSQTQPKPPVEVPDSVHAEVAARVAKLGHCRCGSSTGNPQPTAATGRSP